MPGWLTVAEGARRVPYVRSRVWRALAVLQPYCAVCDVSYVVDGAATKQGTEFVCVPGRLDDQSPPGGAPRGRIVEWKPEHRVATRLELTPEVWVTTIELADAPDESTDVSITLTHEPLAGGLLRRRRQRKTVRKVAQGTIESELDKVADHVCQAEQSPDSADGSSA
ncbi:SRPBCC family protein [Modestobacter muralis]|uniref:SRPBCC family protein n=1 Tax=Modestobacter muralis TaxID=1608614 RepID=A0A6P0EVQ6_9ACTN|nr:SRPBCC family protein [Modestobacter muralis]NEN50135.1 SRPBCC family protein [Modestobacter muralis]